MLTHALSEGARVFNQAVGGEVDHIVAGSQPLMCRSGRPTSPQVGNDAVAFLRFPARAGAGTICKNTRLAAAVEKTGILVSLVVHCRWSASIPLNGGELCRSGLAANPIDFPSGTRPFARALRAVVSFRDGAARGAEALKTFTGFCETVISKRKESPTRSPILYLC